ncbi:NADH-quinone oxidoreductase subunit N [Desulfurobacterium atlanticum]|uniref:NADH-quinone oxidoreductase subunit N n=1 Tax=Desulfurobacterium atlanticum TaxID=240169 RepID=A0A238YZ38_9BACT|nr:NADH-quinone oxidoreductase subunit N [Desulfurobacterium atlanticum]SNR75799.1 NADH-quinone oxidoreductase subunit N [Desulfurobacterium atlanticum]
MNGFALVIPELFQLFIVVVLFILAVSRWEKNVSWFPYLTAIGVVVSVLSLFNSGTLFYGTYKIDLLSQIFKATISIGFFLFSLLAVKNKTVEDEKKPDYLLLLSLSALGLMLISSAVELITIYIALEIASYAFYAVVPLRAKSKEAAEAGIKYIMFSAVMTAISLYGLSFIYADAHTTFLSQFKSIAWNLNTHPMATVGLTLFIVGFLFKIALFPFHFWAPDAYQGMSNETAAYSATIPKLGSIIVLIRILEAVYPSAAVASTLAVFAAIAMTVGNITALVQNDIKRVLGYSSVAHAGYMTVALLVQSKDSLANVVFYAVGYIFMNFLAFWVICKISKSGENITFENLKGLYRKAPVLAFAITVAAMALTGLPPTCGFIGKFFLLTGAWGKGFDWLIVVAALNTAISAYYYLKLVRFSYAEEGNEEKDISISLFDSSVALILSAIVFLIGIIPSPIYQLAIKATNMIK